MVENSSPACAPSTFSFCRTGSPRDNPSRMPGTRLGDSGPHEHKIHAGQHGAIHRGQEGQLDLLQVIDANKTAMAFLGKKNLDKVADDEKLLQQPAGFHGRLRLRAVRLIRSLPAGNVVPLQNPLRDAADRKQVQGAANVASRVAELQSASQDQIQPRSRHNAKLPSPGNRTGQSPGRYPDSHASLNDCRQFIFHMHLRRHLARRPGHRHGTTATMPRNIEQAGTDCSSPHAASDGDQGRRTWVGKLGQIHG